MDNNGFVKAVGAGYCEIHAYSMDEKCYGGCAVWVQPDKIPIEDISVTHTDTSIKLKWKPQENIHGYIIYCDKGDGNGFQEMTTITDPQKTSYEAYGTNVGWYVEPGKTYIYKISPYIKRWDSNYFTHIYETPSDEISVTTYSDSVITSFNTNGVESVGITVGSTTRVGVYCSKKIYKMSYSSDNEEIFAVEDKASNSDNYELEIKGVKEGRANLILKAEDALGYEKKIPVLVYDFQKIKKDIQAEPLIKSIHVTWKVEDREKQDGFKVFYGLTTMLEEITLSMEELNITTDENGDMYAEYTIGGLKSDKDYNVRVAPYKIMDEVTFTGNQSDLLKVHTPVYVNVDNIAVENLHLLHVNESKKITAAIRTEGASEPKLVWVPYDTTIIELTNCGKEDDKTAYAIVKALKTGVSKLNVVADDENNYQVGLTVAVVPEKVTNFVGTAELNSVSLSWKPVDGAEGYALYRYDEKQNVWVNIAKVTDTSYVDFDVIPNTQYRYKAAPYVSDKEGIYEGTHTDELVLTTQKEKETNALFVQRKIKNFKISKNYTIKIKLSWKKDTEAEGYQIYQYKSKKWQSIAAVKKGSAQSVTIKKLKAGMSYQFRIRAYKKQNGMTLYTPYTTLKVMTKPSKVKVTSIIAGKKQVALKWKKMKASGYEIQCCTAKKFNKNVKKIIVKKSKKQATVKKLKSGKTYYIRIRAYSKVNGQKYNGTWSKVKKVTVK